MRLRADQIHIIRQTVRQWAGPAATVQVFGSRLRDDARGGDVDLLVETDGRLSLVERARLRQRLEDRLGLPVDVVFAVRGARAGPFETLARAEGVPL